MNLMVPPPADAVDWSSPPSNGSPDTGASSPLHDRLQHMTLRKKPSYR